MRKAEACSFFLSFYLTEARPSWQVWSGGSAMLAKMQPLIKKHLSLMKVSTSLYGSISLWEVLFEGLRTKDSTTRC